MPYANLIQTLSYVPSALDRGYTCPSYLRQILIPMLHTHPKVLKISGSFISKNYYNPLGASSEDFYEDLKRIKYIKRLVNRYIGYGELSERLILNHLIVFFKIYI